MKKRIDVTFPPCGRNLAREIELAQKGERAVWLATWKVI